MRWRDRLLSLLMHLAHRLCLKVIVVYANAMHGAFGLPIEPLLAQSTGCLVLGLAPIALHGSGPLFRIIGVGSLSGYGGTCHFEFWV